MNVEPVDSYELALTALDQDRVVSLVPARTRDGQNVVVTAAFRQDRSRQWFEHEDAEVRVRCLIGAVYLTRRRVIEDHPGALVFD